MFDLLVWVAFCYLALRILLRPEPRLWPLLGLVAGVGLETKDTVVALLGVFALGLLVVGPRQVLRERRVWTAVAVACACALPYVGWEVAHGWPSLTFLPTQDAATAASTSHASYLVQQAAFLGGVGARSARRGRALAGAAPALARAARPDDLAAVLHRAGPQLLLAARNSAPARRWRRRRGPLVASLATASRGRRRARRRGSASRTRSRVARS
jgi:hypothetical protein